MANPHYDRLLGEDIRRRDAMQAFVRAEMARKRLHRLAVFWMAVALLAVVVTVGVLV